MCMIWHDVTKEPLPKHVDRVLARIYNSEYKYYDFYVLHLHNRMLRVDQYTYGPDDTVIDKKYYWVDVNGPYDSYTYFKFDGKVDYEEYGNQEYQVTHWSYIDPSGITE